MELGKKYPLINIPQNNLTQIERRTPNYLILKIKLLITSEYLLYKIGAYEISWTIATKTDADKNDEIVVHQDQIWLVSITWTTELPQLLLIFSQKGERIKKLVVVSEPIIHYQFVRVR